MTHAIGIERAIEAGIDADIIPLTGEYAGYPGVRLIEYLEMKPASAAELGVVLTLGKDGKPRWHSYSDIAVDEQRDYQTAILTPIIEAAIAAYLSALKPSGDAGEATAWRIAGGMLTNIREVAERYRSDGVEVVPLVPASLITTLERQLATAREALTQIASGKDSSGNKVVFFQDIAGDALASIAALTPGVSDAE